MKKLRHIPGLIQLEEICWNPENMEGHSLAENWPKFNRLSERLFCIHQSDTQDHWADELETLDAETVLIPADFDYDKYCDIECHYDVCDLPYIGDTVTVWNLLGWDLADKNGLELVCADHFKRQIIATEKKLVPGARYCPDLDGRRATGLRSDSEQHFDTAAFAANLERRAEAFMRQRREDA